MVCAIIQARMASTRLPGKVLREICGVPMLKYEVERVRASSLIDGVVVATSVNSADDRIADFCGKNDIECFRGPEEDVLARYYKCARVYGARTIVRLTADCPLIDPRVIDKVIAAYKEGNFDYVSNTIPPQTRKYADGNDVEVFSCAALEKVYSECTDKRDREHVTFHIWNYNNGFKTYQIDSDLDSSGYRMTVDYPEDLEVVEYVIKKIQERGIFGHLEEIIDIIDENSEIKDMNSQHAFGAGWK